MNVGGRMYDGFRAQLETLIYSNYDKLIAMVHDFAFALVSLYVIFIAIAALNGRLGEWTRDAIASLIIVLLVYGMAFESHAYINWIYEPIVNTSNSLMGATVTAISGASRNDFDSSIDAAFSSVFESIYNVGNAADGWGVWMKIKVGFAILILLILFGLSYVVYYALLIVSQVSLHIQFLFGILIFFFSAFKGTRFIFFSWFRDVMTFALWPVFAGIVMGFMLFFFKTISSDIAQLDLANGDIMTKTYSWAVLVGAIGLWQLWKVPSFAAAITGGTGNGFGGIVGGAMGLAASAVLAAKAMDTAKGEGGQYSRTMSAVKRGGAMLGSMYSDALGYSSGRKKED
jgi:hypothetical protein